MGLKKNIVEFLLQLRDSSLSHVGTNTKISSLSFYSLRTVAIFSYSSDDELSMIREFSSQIKNKFENLKVVIVNMSDSIVEESEHEVIFGLLDFNILGLMKARLKNWIYNNKFELMLSFISNPDLICNKLIVSIESDFKSGPDFHENVRHYDLTIKQNSNNFNDQIYQYEHYLTNLKICK